MCDAKMPGSVCGSVWDSFALSPYEVDNVYEDEQLDYSIPNFDSFSEALLTVF